MDNAGWLIQAIQSDGAGVLRLITEVSTARPPRAPKNRAAVFALAMVFACGDPAAVQAAEAAFSRVVRTTDHLSMFFGYAKQLQCPTAARQLGEQADRRVDRRWLEHAVGRVVVARRNRLAEVSVGIIHEPRN